MIIRFAALAIAIASSLALSACASSDSAVPSEGSQAPGPDPTTAEPSPAPAPCQEATCNRPPPIDAPAGALHVKFLGVGGFLLERGDQAVLTAPLFTRPSMVVASTGLPVTSDAALVAARLPSPAMANVRAIISGHAHYDHLLDVPAIMQLAPKATLYSNRSARNLLAAFAPDRGPSCAGKPAQPKLIARSRVVAVDDPSASTVDYTNCPDLKPAGAPLQGRWVQAPGSHVRVLAVCSDHPDQIGPIHYGAGDVEDEQCTPPKSMNEWKEGRTVAFLIDFLDAKDEAPLFRVFYQDAPAETPFGHVPAAFLADKRVDLALMCVGTYDKVDGGSPEKALKALNPRYALGGHWEDFFGSLDAAPKPITLLDVPGWATKAQAAMPGWGEARWLAQNGKPIVDRAVLPQPGDTFDVSP
jgi:hypothetical protein